MDTHDTTEGILDEQFHRAVLVCLIASDKGSLTSANRFKLLDLTEFSSIGLNSQAIGTSEIYAESHKCKRLSHFFLFDHKFLYDLQWTNVVFAI